jgi:hypothetical protein
MHARAPAEEASPVATSAAAALASGGTVALLPLPQARPDNPGGAHFPLGLTPVAATGGAVFDLSSALAWAAAHREEVEAALLAHGGIHFRGFPLRDAAAFDAFMVRRTRA